MEFVKQFNAKTQKDGGILTPVLVSFFSDKSFTFVVKSPPAAVLIIKAISIAKGSGEPNRSKVGKVKKSQLEEIAKVKMGDLNCDTMESAISMLSGTARSMGVTVED
jgi:large subunit ribosomal protein L11